MDDTEIKKAWSELEEKDKQAKFLIEKFFSRYSPEENGKFSYKKEFSEEFVPLAIDQNEIAFSLIREVLERELGEKYKGIYIAAGMDEDFCYILGGQWIFVDRAYNGENGRFSLRETSSKIELKAHDFMTGTSNEIGEKTFDLSIIRHPYGKSSDIIEETGYKAPESEAEVFSHEWWNMYLLNCISPLRIGGLLLTEISLDYNDDEEDQNTIKVIEKYLGQLELLDNLLGLETNSIPLLEYGERINNTEPMISNYVFYRKIAK